MERYDKVVAIIKRIDAYVNKVGKADFDSGLLDEVGMDKIPQLVESFEKVISSLLREQMTYYINAMKKTVKKAENELTVEELMRYYSNDLFKGDEFRGNMSAEATKFLEATTSDISGTIMKTLDKDVSFNRLSGRSMTWIQEWSDQLAKIMDIHSKDQVESVLFNALKDGKGIQSVELALKDLPAFNRNRARTTAITEVLTASSVAQQEAFEQSPSVEGKKWKHSGGKGIAPRSNHMELSGTVVDVDQPFMIPDSGELAMFPRDPSLSPKERINCHCTMGPDVNEDILGWSKEDKEKARAEVLGEMDKKTTPVASSLDKLKENVGKPVKSEVEILETGAVVQKEVDARIKAVTKEFQRVEKEFEDVKSKLLTNDIADSSQYEKKYQDLQKMKQLLADRRAETTANVLSEIRSFDTVFMENFAKGSHVRLSKEISNASFLFPDDWIAKSNKVGSLLVKNVYRGYYMHDNQKATIALNAKYNTFGTAIHEMGHRFEYLVPGLLEAEKQFYIRRTLNEPLVHMGPGYNQKEQTRVDNFIRKYMGKDYDGRAYELFSMGIEGLYSLSYDIYKDKEYLHFILGVLARL
ncbi:hypothetical protein HCA78_11695 [Listeria booriae]|uniref:Phage head morphogenesis domain-containing protein n=1 Tax=Listeria booriae TaxID=1552123 RepID=A0A842CRI1_9LIST|nr:phage minor head protein [Listeria booriae]MBC2004435.1 hypothetical protein [Listeria booriae]